MAVNAELLQKTLDTIKANPEHWYQKNWHCNSSHCFAGFAELLSFGLPIYLNVAALKEDKRLYDPVNCRVDFNWNTKGNATEALGLTEEDATLLFAGGNLLEDLESMVKHLVEFGSLVNWNYGDDDDC